MPHGAGKEKKKDARTAPVMGSWRTGPYSVRKRGAPACVS